MGIESMMKNVQYRVSVVEFNTEKENVKGIPGISSYSNFAFEEMGIRAWKAYGVGDGLLIPVDRIPTISVRRLTVLEQPLDIFFHKLNVGSTNENKIQEVVPVQCQTDGCTDEFVNQTDLLNHLYVGKCKIDMEFSSNNKSDITKKKYCEKLSECSFIKEIVTLPAETKESQHTDLQIGWALKDERKFTRFNSNQKEFLIEKFNVGLKTGRKEDPFTVAESMLHVKKPNGNRRFTYEEILTGQQITSFFSRLTKQTKDQNDDKEAKREMQIDVLRREILND